LMNHYTIVCNNMNRILEQMTSFQEQAVGVASTFGQSHANISKPICKKSVDTDVKHIEIVSLEPSPYLKKRMKVKKIQVDGAEAIMNTFVTKKLQPILVSIEGVLALLDDALRAILAAIQSALNITLDGNHADWLMKKFTDYDEKIRAAVLEAEKPILDMLETLDRLRKGFARLN